MRNRNLETDPATHFCTASIKSTTQRPFIGTPQMQKFNDDLLLGPRDQKNVRRAFPAVFHVLDDDELRSLFRTFDSPATRAKRRSLRAGILAVLLVTVALFGTSAEHLYELYLSPGYAMVLALVSAVFGISGALIGVFGLMIGRSKQEWLQNRMAAELLRQYHFQTFVCRPTEIFSLSESSARQENFANERSQWLSKFKLAFLHHLEPKFHALLNREQTIWIEHPAPKTPSEAILSALPDDFFDAYRALRILHQQQFADWKLRHGEMIVAGFSLRTLEAILDGGSVVATLCLLVTETLAIVPLTFLRDALLAPWAHWLAICFASLALGMRTLEEGLQPKREIERYQRYANQIQDILERFESGSRTVKFETMVEMERLCFEEMRDFLRTFHESRFVM